MSLFFFGNNFYKNKETFKIFSSQILEVYRILLVETTVESIMFYYTFSVINTNSVFQVPPQKIVRRFEILGIGWPGVIGLTRNESVPWEVMPEVFKCSVQGGGLK